ncbi:MAG: 16S rRNA (cytidine(1402)-2'-O)-methyltransferase [Candidatus Pacebacteria bacterium]|nr:16S rRNA (cytidine(1402)-2'-O)-methyltransferase [Candidatus Paceibacterota bacterium]MDR3582850.1 16S rRNA (cytidine(1402)-2'-O)-methyltransferase [Candidatus Paceibacterota bacterium]
MLYIVATPIGNLEDITYRAIRILKEVDLIFCEDTRTTKKLLDHYQITAETRSFYGAGSKTRKPQPKIDYVLDELKAGKNVAFVTDAGTPGISDPGNLLVEKVIENNISAVPIPGVSALTTLASVAGIDLGKFAFLGFPPHKKGRETFFKRVWDFGDLGAPVVYYESPHRLIKNLELLKTLAPEKKIILGRELTKVFEEVVRGNVSEILEYFENNPDKVKGEFAIIVY